MLIQLAHDCSSRFALPREKGGTGNFRRIAILTKNMFEAKKVLKILYRVFHVSKISLLKKCHLSLLFRADHKKKTKVSKIAKCAVHHRTRSFKNQPIHQPPEKIKIKKRLSTRQGVFIFSPMYFCGNSRGHYKTMVSNRNLPLQGSIFRAMLVFEGRMAIPGC